MMLRAPTLTIVRPPMTGFIPCTRAFFTSNPWRDRDLI